MLEEWGLVKIVPREKERIMKEPIQHVRIKVISFKEKDDYTLIQNTILEDIKNEREDRS